MSCQKIPICDQFIACDAMLGAPRTASTDFVPDIDDLESEMSRLEIRKAVVRHRASLEVGGYFGNDVLMDEVAGKDRLIPAWFLTPDGREPSFRPEEIVDRMLAEGVCFAWTDPRSEMFSLQPWCSGKLFTALQERRVPLLLSYEAVDFDDLHQAMAAFPAMRVILLDVPRLGRNRMLEPLLESSRGLHLCFGPSFSVHAGFRDLCRRYGPYRWVWGSGYPDAEGGAAVAGLTYSGLTTEETAAIAHGNIERLMAEVRL